MRYLRNPRNYWVPEMGTFSWQKDDVLKKLPAAYQKFYKEWKETTPTPVHYIPEEGKWKRNPRTGEVKRIQNVPLPLKYPRQMNEGLWGGEAVVKGYQKRKPTKQRVGHWWVPKLKRTVVYSEILDKYLEVVVTERALRLIDENYGLDFYLLKTPACDLVSRLALRLKQKMLLSLVRKDLYPSDPVKREEIWSKYRQFIVPEEEASWYGLMLKEAVYRHECEEAAKENQGPLKHKLRQELIEKLREMQIKGDLPSSSEVKQTSWMSRLNPFGDRTLEKST